MEWKDVIKGKEAYGFFIFRLLLRGRRSGVWLRILHFPSSAPGDGAGNFSDPTLNIMIWGHLS